MIEKIPLYAKYEKKLKFYIQQLSLGDPLEWKL